MTAIGAGVLADRYELGETVGSGGMADVYRATDRLLNRTVAIKMLRTSATDSGARDRFTAEARTLASLSHPGLVTLLDAGILDEHPYLVMELVDGPALSQAIRDGGPMDPVRVAHLGGQIAEALAYTHANDVVHRDVKPGNILVTSDGRALLTDFGIARLISEDPGHTRTGETIGSPAYLSPEQVRGDRLSEAVDVYSLGLVLLEALTATRAYPGTPVEAAVARLSAAPAIPTSLNSGWRDLLIKMTRRDPSERPTALEVAATLNSSFTTVPAADPVTDLDAETAAFDFTRHTGPIPVPAADETRLDLLSQKEPVRGPRRIWSAVAAAVVIALVIVGGAVFLRPDETAPAPAYRVPAGVPKQMQQPLENLHRAVDRTAR